MKRLRFSLRTLAIVVTLVCLYLGLRQITLRNFMFINDAIAKKSSRRGICRSEVLLPLILVCDEVDMPNYNSTARSGQRRYHVWLFGTTMQLPIEQTWTSTIPLHIIEFDLPPETIKHLRDDPAYATKRGREGMQPIEAR